MGYHFVNPALAGDAKVDPTMPIHYDLHAWVYRHNPDGELSAWNPTLSCP